ncbi:MAG: hypothetical protein IIB82_16635 [Bacteroidetes bacterium]|nr:hypothetical protein [Bacteroidota bacterium]
MIRFKRKLTSKELLKEKRKDYRNIVIIQVTIVIVGLLLSDIILEEQESLTSKLIITLFSMFSALYVYLLWDLLRDFTSNQFIIKGVIFVITGVVIVGTLTEFPFYNILEFENRRTYLFVLHGCIFPIEVLVIAFTIRDIFGGNVLTPEKLWGAACIYLMIGISFASLYDLINFASPGCFGPILPLGIPSYSECIYYSFNILGGTETIYPDPIRLVRNIGVIEAVWGNLFIVLIIGKLLTLPRMKDADE